MNSTTMSSRTGKRAQRTLGQLILIMLTLGSCAVYAAPSASISLGQQGVAAGKNYTGDGIGISQSLDGVTLRVDFQKLQGRATPQGLWLESTDATGKSDQFRVMASSVDRENSIDQMRTFEVSGSVLSRPNTVTFTRPGLIEEYSVSMDGVRQDFIVQDRPTGDGELLLTLKVSGARVAAGDSGAKLTLTGSGREISYGRLRVTDDNGRLLAASFVGTDSDAFQIRVNDASATYPVRIDPTFSDADWFSVGRTPGPPPVTPTGNVFASTVDENGNLYIGSDNRVWKWNGSSWSPLGSEFNGQIRSLVVSGVVVYAGGEFNTAGGVRVNHVAKWNGSNWAALSDISEGDAYPGVDGPVYALALSGANLFVGGSFGSAGLASASNIAKWNGSGWGGLGLGVDAGVNALALNGTELYVGGAFGAAGGESANYIAKWNGSSWSALGLGTDSYVFAITTSGADLYVGGDFAYAGTVSVDGIAKWNGSTWSALGSGPGGEVDAVTVSGGSVYAGGLFGVSKWNGTEWASPGIVSLWVATLSASAGKVYAGGGGLDGPIVQWDGSEWSAVAEVVPQMPGLSGGEYPGVNAIAISGTNIYVAGVFSHADGMVVNNIARWDGAAWHPLGTGTSGAVYCLAVIGSDLFVGGNFSTAGAVTVNNIAKWDGVAWSGVGGGADGSISVILGHPTGLYAGGSFTSVGGVSANNIAKWNGNAWSPLGNGVSGTYASVKALAFFGADLYVGGNFSWAGEGEAKKIAKWDGSSWSPLGPGLSAFNSYYEHWDSVSALAVFENELYVGGRFKSAGSVTLNSIAKWNGSQWSALGTGVTYMVAEMAAVGSDLYIVGDFATVAGVSANNIAKWNGSTWSAMGSGTDDTIYAMAASPSNIYVGGSFTTAGGKPANYIARAAIGATVLTPIQTWRQTWLGGIDNAGDAANSADPNHNGIVNLMEYALNGDPSGRTTSTGILPQGSKNPTSNRLQIAFARYIDRTDLTLTVQANDDLTGSWTDLAQSVNGAAFTILAPGASVVESGTGSTRAVIVGDLYQVNDPSHRKRFMRLAVSNP